MSEWDALVARVEALEAELERLRPPVHVQPAEEPVDPEEQWRRRLEIVAIGGAEGHPDLVEARTHVAAVRAIYGPHRDPISVPRGAV